jgi:hypothetical protein
MSVEQQKIQNIQEAHWLVLSSKHQTVKALSEFGINLTNMMAASAEWVENGAQNLESRSDQSSEVVLDKLTRMMAFWLNLQEAFKMDDVESTLPDSPAVTYLDRRIASFKETLKLSIGALPKRVLSILPVIQAEISQIIHETVYYASDVVFKMGGKEWHRLFSDEQEAELRDLKRTNQTNFNQKVEQYQKNLHDKYQKIPDEERVAEWEVSFGIMTEGDDGEFQQRIAEPLKIRAIIPDLNLETIKKYFELRSNTGLCLVELIGELNAGGENTFILSQGDSEVPIPFDLAMKLIVDKVPMNREMFEELLVKGEENAEGLIVFGLMNLSEQL